MAENQIDEISTFSPLLGSNPMSYWQEFENKNSEGYSLKHLQLDAQSIEQPNCLSINFSVSYLGTTVLPSTCSHTDDESICIMMISTVKSEE